MGRVRFSDVVKRVNVFVDREHTDLLYYVGGEHIDSDAFMVRKKGLIKGATIGYKFHFGFQPGHILFMSRNPHLRKCSMVDFAGVCSDSTYVVETRDENVLLQKYLLIEMQSDRFWKWAEENKSGSVNYLINYCTLDSYEFDLPPIEEQRALAEKLWAANDLKEKYRHLLAATDEMLKAKFREMFKIGAIDGYGRKRIADIVLEVRYGTSRPAVDDGEYPYLRMNNLTYEGGFDLSDLKRITVPVEELDKCLVHKGDLLFNRTNSKELVGKTAVFQFDDPMVIAGYIIRVRLKKEVEPIYLSMYLNLPSSKKMLSEMAKGSVNQTNINAKEFQSISVPVPPVELQREFVAIANAAEASKAELKKSITSIDAVMNGLINERL